MILCSELDEQLLPPLFSARCGTSGARKKPSTSSSASSDGDDGGSGIGRLQTDTVIGCRTLQLSLILIMY